MTEELAYPEPDSLVDLCVEQIRTGQAAAADCLESYPQFADEMAPILYAADRLASAEPVSLDPLAFQLIEKRLMSHARSLQRAERRTEARQSWVTPLLLRFAAALVIIASVAGITGGAMVASADSLPGEPLYAVKRLSENIQLVFTQDTLQRASLNTSLAFRRWDEAARQYERSGQWNSAVLQDMARYLEHAASQLEQQSGPALGEEWARVATISQAAEQRLAGAAFGEPDSEATLGHLHRIRERAAKALGMDNNPRRQPEAAPPGETTGTSTGESIETPESTRKNSAAHQVQKAPNDTHVPGAPSGQVKSEQKHGGQSLETKVPKNTPQAATGQGQGRAPSSHAAEPSMAEPPGQVEKAQTEEPWVPPGQEKQPPQSQGNSGQQPKQTEQTAGQAKGPNDAGNSSGGSSGNSGGGGKK